ncbi:hypothetical protein [Endozoicomonas elysicola]|uniref:Uncharacterized protein n=1 Tax=Endozoicomonas elysicola TaxID=305900 RepID=A0A081KEX3_9GAMM|nr:hypothetical protein [Endozoicomonas elysicola]KEI72699.1 hypothetical protein GV64_19975 [Endozoicomonas elysicola]
MVRKIYLYLLIHSIFSLCTLPSAVSAKEFNCIQFLNQPVEQQREKFTAARDQLIEHFSKSDSYGFSTSDLASLLRKKKFDPDIGNGVYLVHLPNFIFETNQHINADFVKDLYFKINNLETIGKCFHYQAQETSPQPLMALKLYTPEDSNPFDASNQVFMGYTTVSTLNGKPAKQARVTSPQECATHQCIFTNTPLEQARELLKTNTVIRLIHNPKELAKVVYVAPDQPDENHLPLQTWLTEVTLFKTGEIFTRPEIYMTIAYYSEEQLISKVARPLPWVNKKGINTGSSLLLEWPTGSDRAKLTVMESDMDIPYRSIANIILGIFQHFISDSYASPAITSIAEHMQDQPKSATSWGDDDYIGKVTVHRRGALTDIMTDEGTATLKLQHKYK